MSQAASESKSSVEVKVLLTTINEQLDILNHLIETRCMIIMKMILQSKHGENIAGAYDEIVVEYCGIKNVITEYTNQVKKALACGQLTDSVEPQDSNRPSIPRTSLMSDVSKISGMDHKKLADNLKAMMVIMGNFENENKKLKADNRKLHGQMLELVHSVMGVGKKEEVFTVTQAGRMSNLSIMDDKEKAEHKRKIIQIEEEEETDVVIELDLKKIMGDLKEDFECTFVEYTLHTSSYNILGALTTHDQSFNYESETLELTEKEWKERLGELHATSKELTVLEAKLYGIKAFIENM